MEIKISSQPYFNKLLTIILTFTLVSCSSEDSAASGAYPSDKQVIQDVTPKNKTGLIDVSVVKGKQGEAYLHKKDLIWYWDRGVIIKRKADLHGAPDAVLVVGGLARYQKMGDQYKFAKFLTTYNEYEGIPAPDEDDLLDYVKGNLDKVFISREHNIMDISSINLNKDEKWNWHSATSFSVPFQIRYKERTNNTTIQERDDVFDIRFYRNTLDAPIHALMATEKTRNIIGEKQYAMNEIDQMKTLRTGF